MRGQRRSGAERGRPITAESWQEPRPRTGEPRDDHKQGPVHLRRAGLLEAVARRQKARDDETERQVSPPNPITFAAPNRRPRAPSSRVSFLLFFADRGLPLVSLPGERAIFTFRFARAPRAGPGRAGPRKSEGSVRARTGLVGRRPAQDVDPAL